MIPIACFSLCLLAALSVSHGWLLSAGETIRLGAIAAMMAWWLAYRHPKQQQDGVWPTLVAALAYLFIMARCDEVGPDLPWQGLSADILLAAASLGVMVARLPVATRRWDKAAYGGIAAVALLGAVSRSGRGKSFEPLVQYGWLDVLFIGKALLLYFAITQVMRQSGARRYGRILLWVACAAFVLGAVVGMSRIAIVYAGYRSSLADFRAGNFEETLARAQSVEEAASRRNCGPEVSGRILEAALIAAPSIADPIVAYKTVGALALQLRQWAGAATAYRSLARLVPEYPNIDLMISVARFEEGHRHQVLERLTGDSTGTSAWAFAVMLAKMGRWGEANKALDRALMSLEQGWSLEEWVAMRKQGATPIADLVPADWQFFWQRLSLDDVKEVLQARGWQVRHGGERIGTTRVAAPVDIVLVSGMPGEEFIAVGGERVSLGKRGYNVVAIDPLTGAVADVQSFDTWENMAEGRRMGIYLNEMPRGMIVAAAISDEGSGGLVGSSRDGLQSLGVRSFPTYAWRHALIGGKGSPPGTAVESLGNRAVVRVAALTSNMSHGTVEDSTRLRELLQSTAQTAQAGVAVYIPALDLDAVVHWVGR